MKIFLDTANLDELKKGAAWGVVDGVTTNPTLIAKEGRPMAEQVRMICDIVDGDISAEVVSTETKEMVREGRELARMFAWMRPNDLIWNYWVNNYLLGNAPPAFDVLYWNNDTTRLPARLHADFLDLMETNPYVNAGQLEVRGKPLDMRRVNMESYVVAGVTDHITPWQGCYRTAKLYGAGSTFVLSNSGHIQSLLNPPGNPKATFWAGAAEQESGENWLAHASKNTGSWWPHWLEWIKARSGEIEPAPRTLGNVANPPLDDAPGRYVMEK